MKEQLNSIHEKVSEKCLKCERIEWRNDLEPTETTMRGTSFALCNFLRLKLSVTYFHFFFARWIGMTIRYNEIVLS
jgi:hypothetical protein